MNSCMYCLWESYYKQVLCYYYFPELWSVLPYLCLEVSQYEETYR